MQLVLMHAVLSALFSLSLVVLNFWSHKLVVLRFEGIAGPQASLFQVALISHLRFNAFEKQVQCVHARMQLASYEDLHATSPCDRLHQAGAI